jgi:GNAT superfamily N-acetyltransferase
MNAPPGKIETVVTYLEMTAQPTTSAPPRPAIKLAMLRAESPPVEYYRFLYGAVGGPWLWYERQLLDDEALGAIVQDPAVEVYVLYVGGVPAGYSELDGRRMPDIELAYFGLMPGYIGRGLGRYLLGWTVDQAWTRNPHRLWVHTCDLDHPRALGLYQRAGFVPYRQETIVIDDPKVTASTPGDG